MLIVDQGTRHVQLHLNDIVHEDESADDDRLADFETVQASIDVDRVGAEDG